MQIVINIPDEEYDVVQNEKYHYIISHYIWEAVKNGVVLPKGHGDLKDFDKIEWYGCDFEDGKTCIKNRGNCDICTFANCDANKVRNLPTIIGADKGDE